MTVLGRLVATLIVLIQVVYCVPADEVISDGVSKIAFGSCNRRKLPQDMWDDIVDYKPDLWVWLGDVVYADKMTYPTYWESSTIDEMKDIYNEQKNKPAYTKLRGISKIIGVWDDHDYGMNDGDYTYKYKNEVKEIFMDFVDEPETSVRRSREGLYGSYSYGEPPNQVKIILLDTRYFREGYTGDGNILGEAQWAWLEDQLTNSTAQIHLIGSGTQVIPNDIAFIEKWSCFPNARKRLFKLIGDTKVPGAIILSGDVHHGETFSIYNKELAYPLFEVTSSGITHTCGTQLPGNLCEWLLKNPMKSVTQLDVYTGLNFGVIEIDWEAKNVIVQIRDKKKVVIEHVLPFANMKEGSFEPSTEECTEGPDWAKWPKYKWGYIVYAVTFLIFILSMYTLYCCCACCFCTSKKQKQS